MLNCTKTITVYISKKTSGGVVYTPIQLAGVSIAGSDQTLYSSQNASQKDEYTIRIPAGAITALARVGRQYVDKNTYRALPEEEIDNVWTLQKGDMLVTATVDEPINSPGDLTRRYGGDALKITELRDNRSGSHLSHFKVVAKA